MYTLVNPSFIIQKWGLRGSKLYRCVFVMPTLVSDSGFSLDKTIFDHGLTRYGAYILNVSILCMAEDTLLLDMVQM